MSKNTNLSFLTDYITADITNGRIGINNASPAYAFDVTGIARTSTSTYLATASGNVGIGTTSPDALLTVAGTNQATGAAFNTYGNVLIYSTDSYAQNKGGALSLGGKYNSAGTPIATFARIHGKKENATVDSTAGYLSFETVPEATALLTERMRINSIGNVGIGSNSIRAKLDVSDGTVNTSGEAIYQGLFTGPSRPSTSDLTAILTIQSNDAMAADKGGSIAFGGRAVSASSSGANWAGIGGLKENATSANYNGYLSFWTRGGSTTEKMRITSGGNMLMAKDAAIGINTSDGADNGYLALCGASADGENRGGHIYLSGNERSADPGSVVISAGNVIGTGSFIFFRTAGTEKVRIVGSGNVIIGSTSDNGYKLQVTGSIYATGSIVANSDIILKKNILKIENALEKIKQISGYTYEFKADDSKRHAGVIAQEIQKVLPEIVNKGNDGILGVEYGNMSALLIEAIKELSKEINLLKNK